MMPEQWTVLETDSLGDRVEPSGQVFDSLPEAMEYAAEMDQGYAARGEGGRYRVYRLVLAEVIGADPCTDIPDAPEPGRWQPPAGARIRNGRKVPLHLYLHAADDPVGRPIGVIYHSPELARFVVEAINAELRAGDHAVSLGGVGLGGAPYPELMAIYRGAEALLAGRNAGHPELLRAELRRMQGDLRRAIGAVEDMLDAGEGSADA